MDWNINFDICSIAILIIMLFFNSQNTYKKQTIVLHFRRMLLLTLFCGILDIICSPLLRFTVHFYYAVYFMIILFFLAHIVCTHYYYSFLYFHVSNNGTFDARRFHFFSIPFFLLELLTLSTPFTNALFILTPDGTYMRGWGLVLLVYVLIIYILSILWLTLFSQNNVSTFLKKCVLFFSIIIILCILCQMFISPATHLLVFSLTIAELVLQFSLLNPQMIEHAIQDEKEAKLQAQQQKHSAELATKAKSKFLSNMSHEIRTPITSILGMNELILRESSESSIQNYAKNIKNAGQALLSIINNILDISKIETGNLELHPTEYRLDLLLYELVSLMSFQAKSKKLSLQLDIEEGLPNHLYGDKTRIRQIITNLLSNAVKYTSKGSVSLKMYGTLASEKNILLTFSVTDTGIGIREEDQNRIFDSFKRLEEEKHHHISGTGLGLSITKQFVALMDGEIHVNSVYGKGSTFTVTLPQQIISDEPIGNFNKKLEMEFHLKLEENLSFLAPSAQILVVDDNAMNLEVISGLLKRNQIQITTATSGEECLSLIQNNYYHIILIDHLMSDMSGVQTLHNMRCMTGNLCKNSPVIVITADVVSGAREYYLSEGFDDYLTKPVIIHELESTLLKYLPPELVTNYTFQDTMNRFLNCKKTHPFSTGPMRIQAELGLFYTGNNIAQYRTLLSLFLEHTVESQKKLSNLLLERNLKEYKIQVHALKSNARIIGAEELAEAAYEQEQYAGKEEVIHVQDGFDKLIDIWNLTIEGIKDYLQSSVSKLEEKTQHHKTTSIPNDYLSNALAEMLQALMEYDNLQAMEIINDLQQYDINTDFSNRLSPVFQAVRDFDYSDAILLLQQILNKG